MDTFGLFRAPAGWVSPGPDTVGQGTYVEVLFNRTAVAAIRFHDIA
jgi:hypothetical protein